LTLNILLVEDEPAQIYLVRTALRRWKSPYALHVSMTADDALAFINRGGPHAGTPSPHLVLVDINLPGRPGFSVIREIKESANLRGIAVIVMSTSVAPADVKAAVDLHTNAYIRKPLEWAEMERVFDALESFWRLDVRFAMQDPTVKSA
jgi:CheY-like chemotaxis protein